MLILINWLNILYSDPKVHCLYKLRIIFPINFNSHVFEFRQLYVASSSRWSCTKHKIKVYYSLTIYKSVFSLTFNVKMAVTTALSDSTVCSFLYGLMDSELKTCCSFADESKTRNNVLLAPGIVLCSRNPILLKVLTASRI